MKEGDKRFDIPLFKEVYNEEYGYLVDRIRKTVTVTAPSLCEAIVKAVKNNNGFSYDHLSMKK